MPACRHFVKASAYSLKEYGGSVTMCPVWILWANVSQCIIYFLSMYEETKWGGFWGKGIPFMKIVSTGVRIIESWVMGATKLFDLLRSNTRISNTDVFVYISLQKIDGHPQFNTKSAQYMVHIATHVLA